jgi:hypothetical protein
MSLFLVENGVMPTTAVRLAVTTGTAIKTMLQVKPNRMLRVVEWGVSFNASALAVPIAVELVETGTVFATVTTLAEADVTKLDDLAALAADSMDFGTAATGFTATAEGTITSIRSLDATRFISVLSQPFLLQMPLGQWTVVQKANAVRIRVTAPAAVNCYCYMKLST